MKTGKRNKGGGETINRKIICLSIVGLLILVGMTMSGCAKPPAPPVARISATPSSVTFGESITFSGAASTDSDGNITSYNWDFGDGNTSIIETRTYAYLSVGTYNVKLTVTDNDGLSGTAELSVEVVGLASIKIEATTSTWRSGEQPYDIYGTIKEKLEKAGFEVVPQESTDYDAILLVDYKEKMGSGYSFGRGGPVTGIGTDITCNLTFKDKAGNIIFEKIIYATTPGVVSSGDLYSAAVDDFEDEDYFEFLGKIIAAEFTISAPLIQALNGDAKAVELLIQTLEQALEDKEKWVQIAAEEALVKIGEPAVELLIQALEDEDEDVRDAAAEALGEIGDARAVEPLIQALEDEDSSVRYWAAWALGKIGDARAVEPLTQALNDENASVRDAAEEALEKIRGE